MTHPSACRQSPSPPASKRSAVPTTAASSTHRASSEKCPLTYLASIVFIHGLTGNRDNTWTARDSTEPWPKTLLPSVLAASRILTFGYDAYVADWRGMVSQNRIANHAWNLLTSLSSYRENDGTVGTQLLGYHKCTDAHRMNDR